MQEIYKIVTIADIHFGCSESPQYMYEQLKAQFHDKLLALDHIDVIAVVGDLFDSKMIASNPAITYAIQFVDDLAQLAYIDGTTIILLAGTQSHDAGQLSLFYHYMSDPSIDFRIVENIQFEDVKGLRFLCIPELYGVSQEVYENALYNSGGYDMCLLHGTLKNSFHGTDIATINTVRAPIWSLDNFLCSKGPILAGHYHIPGVYSGHMYYNGSAFRYKFGEEEEKGFLVTAYNPYTRYYQTELVPIKSHIYSTIHMKDLVKEDPKVIIDWIKEQKEKIGADYIRVQFDNAGDNMDIVRNYFRTSSTVKLQELDRKDKQLQEIDQQVLEQNKQYSYITDPSIGDYDKFVMYINQNEGFEFITSDELIKILEGGI